MKLEITLTDEQAAPFVAALEKLANPLVVVTPGPTPALPEPPEGFHKAMMGPLKVDAVNGSQEEDIAQFCDGERWIIGAVGFSYTPYALRIGSEIARLNGLEPEAIPADKEPEPAKRREWDASVSKQSGNVCYRLENDSPELWEFTRVREVLPGDPTMEQVEELVREARYAMSRMSRKGIDAFELNAALQPFTGKESK